MDTPLPPEVKSQLTSALDLSRFRQVGPYREMPEGISRCVRKREVDVEIRLTNFTARIAAQSIHDDGAQQVRRFEIDARLGDRRRCFNVGASEFASLAWVFRELGAAAYLAPGAATRDHVRAAIQLLSGTDIPERCVFSHMGWRDIDGSRVYLHGDGGIGGEGLLATIATDFSHLGPLGLARLPPSAAGADRIAAVQTSLALLDLAPLRISAPLLAAIWRAPFGKMDFALWLAGPTGAFKSELAALAQQHWGRDFHAKALPGSWSSTANSNENLAFAAKDMLLVVDDFAPDGSRSDIDRLHSEAARLLRAQGNSAGRSRLQPDGTPRAARPPRALILGTGEDLPRGQSIRARCWVAELQRGDIDPARLAVAQRHGASGAYAQAMACWLQWLAASQAPWHQFEGTRERLRQTLRSGSHARTPWIAADLIAALRLFLGFALRVGALDSAEMERLQQNCQAAIEAAGRVQGNHHRSENPVERFVEQISAALATGVAHLAQDRDGVSAPANPERLGWRRDGGYGWRPFGELIGWTDGITVWLEPSAAFRLAQRLCLQEGTPLGINKDTLWRRMVEAGLHAMCSPGRNMHEKKIAGEKRKLIALALPTATGAGALPPEETADSKP